MILWWLGLGCAPSEPDPCDDVSWERTAQPFLDTWCTSCHSSTLPAEERQGAPVGVDYDRYASVLAARAGIERQISGDAPSMPPGGGLDLAARDRMITWLTCGAEGTDTEPAPTCDDATQVSTFEGCTEGFLSIQGSLTLPNETDVSCLCRVEGDLTVGASATFERLETVQGALRLEGEATAVQFPSLARSGAIVIDAPALTSLGLDRLRTVSGPVTVLSVATPRLPLDGIITLAGALTVEGGTDVVQIDLDRLESVGGGVRIRDLPALRLVTGTHGLVAVRGALQLTDLPDLARVDGFSVLRDLEGPLTISRTGVTQIRGFDRLVEVATVEIDANPNLVLLDALPDLEQVGGNLVLSANDALTELDTWYFVTHIDGSLVVSEHEVLAEMPPLDRLERVGGDVTLRNNPALSTLTAEQALEDVSIGGTLTIEGNG